jgi:hypothetical protein
MTLQCPCRMGVISDDWCGWRILPPGFQFPVKELVASNLEKRNSPLIKGLLHAIQGELHKLSFFAIINNNICWYCNSLQIRLGALSGTFSIINTNAVPIE